MKLKHLLPLLIWLVVPLAQAELTPEQARLSIIMRQLELIEHLAVQTSTLPPSQTRYHFDYNRFQKDLHHFKAGIEDYLTPQRAQPRDLIEFSDYIQESGGR